ncbi:MAG: hypothetical protein HY319_22660 [Armatimonadetes bacterium]|nr:hypothetical protein [Armatimonadota bacterium]
MSQVYNNAVSNAAQTVGAPRRVAPAPRETESETTARDILDRETEVEKTRQTVRDQASQASANRQQKARQNRVGRRVVRRAKSQGARANAEVRQTSKRELTWARTEPKVHRGPLGKTQLWNRLKGEASLNRASLAFEQQQATQPDPNHPKNIRNRTFLTNLVRMTRISLAQHTGGAAGEAFSRRDTRQILSALSGLQRSQDASNRRRETPRVRHTEAELRFKTNAAQALIAVFEPEAAPADYNPVSLVA